MIDISLALSLLSLAVSSYALYRGGPIGPKGDVGDTGARGPQGEQGETGSQGEKGEPGSTATKVVERARQAVPEQTKFLSREERRDQIAERAYDPDLQTRLEEIRDRLQEGSGLIKADPDAQSNQPDWRKRNAR
jgi:hypothetical protein